MLYPKGAANITSYTLVGDRGVSLEMDFKSAHQEGWNIGLGKHKFIVLKHIFVTRDLTLW